MSGPDTTSSAAAEADRPAGWRVGTLRGIPIYIGGGWVVIGVVMVALFGPQIADTLPGLGLWAYAVALGYAVLLLLSVLVHEAAHALTALACGFRVHRIAADLMGGHTAYDAARATPGRSALVALAARWPTGSCAWWAGRCCPMCAATSPGCCSGRSRGRTASWRSSTCCRGCRWTAATCSTPWSGRSPGAGTSASSPRGGPGAS